MCEHQVQKHHSIEKSNALLTDQQTRTIAERNIFTANAITYSPNVIDLIEHIYKSPTFHVGDSFILNSY